MKEINNVLKDRKEIIFLDLEGTQESQEIIAIGAVSAKLDNKNRIKSISPRFKVYIKSQGPVGYVVTNLTGITDELLKEQGVSFKEGIEKFKRFLKSDFSNKVFATYGNFDLRLLKVTSDLNDMMQDELILNIFKNHWDLASFFARYMRNSKGSFLSLKDSLSIFNVTFDGEEHDPSFDAYNLALLYDSFTTSPRVVQEEYKKLLDSNGHLPWPIIKVIQKINLTGSCSKEEYNEFIKEYLK
ncbi:MAG: exonuclease domain-containing protein [Mollicutes bacterium]|nr:exonuclease domain-containing protein [Mollicutes bacterium]MDD7264227.1 exonuclease domain-containing protein [bacterium]MDY4979330.1 3'-5' exonuclease [Candidatus Onthovivens sp.]